VDHLQKDVGIAKVERYYPSERLRTTLQKADSWDVDRWPKSDAGNLQRIWAGGYPVEIGTF
jgi:hypothetical protein